MIKKMLAVLLAGTMALGLTACSGGAKSKWTNEDFIFSSGSQKVNVENGYFMAVYDDYSFVEDLEDYDYEEYEKEFVTNRGLELGMGVEDYKKLYSVMSGYAIWEILYTENGEDWTTFDSYNNQKPEDMYESKTNSVWLDIGFVKDGGNWKALTDKEVMDVWFCDAPQSDYGEVVILSVGFNDDGKIAGILLYHFEYDDTWAVFQDWA